MILVYSDLSIMISASDRPGLETLTSLYDLNTEGLADTMITSRPCPDDAVPHLLGSPLARQTRLLQAAMSFRLLTGSWDGTADIQACS
jgi:hypothetical protein